MSVTCPFCKHELLDGPNTCMSCGANKLPSHFSKNHVVIAAGVFSWIGLTLCFVIVVIWFQIGPKILYSILDPTYALKGGVEFAGLMGWKLESLFHVLTGQGGKFARLSTVLLHALPAFATLSVTALLTVATLLFAYWLFRPRWAKRSWLQK